MKYRAPIQYRATILYAGGVGFIAIGMYILLGLAAAIIFLGISLILAALVVGLFDN